MAAQANAEGLALYHYRGCPFCDRVHAALARLGVEIALCDILADHERYNELVAATGRQTVPCLRIEEEGGEVRWLHESADIIRWLEQRFAA